MIMIIFFFIFSDRLFTFLKSRQAKNAICDLFSLEWGFSYGRGHVKKGILLCKATFKWATSMSHKSPNWTPGIQHLWYQYIIIISINISTLYVSTWKTFKSKYSKTLMYKYLVPNKLNILVYITPVHKNLFLDFQKCRAVLCYILIDKQMLH